MTVRRALAFVVAACIAAPASAQRPAARELVVRVLDVGQGDAILIQNGGSTVLVDGGPDPAALGRHLDDIDRVEVTDTFQVAIDRCGEVFLAR